MNLILDTNIILWWLEDNSNLSRKYRSAISDTDNICFVSAASIWEISIKRAIGKLEIPADYLDLLLNQGFNELPVSWQHANEVKHLPFHHRDPFDRLLIAQALIEDLTLLTADEIISQYKVTIL